MQGIWNNKSCRDFSFQIHPTQINLSGAFYCQKNGGFRIIMSGCPRVSTNQGAVRRMQGHTLKAAVTQFS